MDNLIVRQAISSDIPDLVKLDHDYSSDHVWQMGVTRGPDEIGCRTSGRGCRRCWLPSPAGPDSAIWP
jgi:hypothetical protein